MHVVRGPRAQAGVGGAPTARQAGGSAESWTP